MKKNLYSLTLSDEVVREVDALAHRLGTNRSALVNRILSEYVSVPTPERQHQRYFRGHRGARFPLARAGAVFRAELAVHVAQIEPRLQVPSDGQV
ncbi:MAG: CopG family transcriptional regulator [Oscillospiraceae bacterium]